MVLVQTKFGTYHKCLPGDPNIGRLMRAGATIYRKSGHGFIYVVPDGMNHGAAWAQVARDPQ